MHAHLAYMSEELLEPGLWMRPTLAYSREISNSVKTFIETLNVPFACVPNHRLHPDVERILEADLYIRPTDDAGCDGETVSAGIREEGKESTSPLEHVRRALLRSKGKARFDVAEHLQRSYFTEEGSFEKFCHQNDIKNVALLRVRHSRAHQYVLEPLDSTNAPLPGVINRIVVFFEVGQLIDIPSPSQPTPQAAHRGGFCKLL